MNLFSNPALYIYLVALNVPARDIIVVTYEKDLARANKVKDYMVKKHFIPESLIKVKWRAKPCQQIKNAIYQVCLKEKGGFSFPIIKQKILVNSFSVFKQLPQEKIKEKKGRERPL